MKNDFNILLSVVVTVVLSTAVENCNCEDCIDAKGWDRTLLTSNPS